MTSMSLADQVIEAGVARGRMLATAESCTGGLIAGALTDIPGSSAVVDRGFVTYSNEAKQEMLAVPAELIEDHGAVSQPVAEAMARGALERSRADMVIAVTGVAGPGGGTEEKPVGLVWFGLAQKGGDVLSFKRNFSGSRQKVRADTVRTALETLLATLTGEKRG